MLYKFKPLKVRKIKVPGQSEVIVKWSNMLESLLQFTKDGFTPDAMRKTIKILDKLESAFKSEEEKNLTESNEIRFILFTEEEVSLIKSKFAEGFKFSIADKAILEFIEDVENMPQDTSESSVFVGDEIKD